MNIKIPSLNQFGNYSLKSTKDRMERQAKRDNQVAFFEQQKENLKNMKTDSIEDISRKLDLLHNYDEQIAVAKKAYNNSQVFHLLDEARELGEKIAKEAEKNAPKTAKERREDMIEEATGVEKNEGMLGDMLEELEEVAEEVTKEMTEELKDMTDEMMAEENADQMVQSDIKGDLEASNNYFPDKYKRIDYRV